MVSRYSSRRDADFSSILTSRLINAISYDRIAGYFSSSILEIADEAIESMSGKMRLICNSTLSADDVKTAQLAANALRNEWCASRPENLPSSQNRFTRLYEFLKSGKLDVRVLPEEKFGLAHGKAGMITFSDGSRTAFLGSVNETYAAWKKNYEIVWEDNSEESVNWVKEEFDALWNDPCAIKLSDYIIEDIKRISNREVISSVEEWRALDEPDAAAAIAESPVNRDGFGLWEHQKYFISRAFEDHKQSYGARYVLADQVGLGKTVQLALSAELMALYGVKPVLIIVPKTLLEQWQNELVDLLGIPSAIWNNGWIDEGGIYYPLGITQCPRRFGIISQGIINNGSESCKALQDQLLAGTYECVVCDEAHRARRRDLSLTKMNRQPEMNNLYNFLYNVSPRTHSLLLATATPVQMHPIEAYDLLNILSNKNDSVLGSKHSRWRNRQQILMSLDLITEKIIIQNIYDCWDWMRNPLPPSEEAPTTFGRIRSEFEMSEDDYVCNGALSDFSKPLQSKYNDLLDKGFFPHHNPYIRHIIRRERGYLEDRINPETGQPYLQPIKVDLFGESSADSLPLQGYLSDAYNLAVEFCTLIQKRCPVGGFLKTLLLKRIGSSMFAGLCTGRKMLEEWNLDDEFDNNEEEEVSEEIRNLTSGETTVLRSYVSVLETAMASNEQVDPKFDKVMEILRKGAITKTGLRTRPWKDLGCIIFSQYFDTANWVARNISMAYPDETIGLYAGGAKSCTYHSGEKMPMSKEEIKKLVKIKTIKILVGTDAASEGLNLQTLGTLINLDLPWNPTKLEQRKGRIQRIGQGAEKVYIYNLKYKDSVEDRVHELLSYRLENLYTLFGQIPDVLEDVWVYVAVNEIEAAKQKIDTLPTSHPFAVKYNEHVRPVNWESCSKVLNTESIHKALLRGWQ